MVYKEGTSATYIYIYMYNVNFWKSKQGLKNRGLT